MSGWAVLGIVVGVVAVLFALAWWSSGRSRPYRGEATMSETEKDYLQHNRFPTGRHGGGNVGGGL